MRYLICIIISIEPVPELIVYALKRMVLGRVLAVFQAKAREPKIGLVRQPGWLSPKSCKMLRILRFQAEVFRKLEVSEQLYSTKPRNLRLMDRQSLSIKK
jgi:hypothetical protein